MTQVFENIGRFSVRFRYMVVAAWIVITFLSVQLLPSLASVAKDTTSGFLPSDSPSMQASVMAAPFQDSTLAVSILVAARDGGLTAADNAAINGIVTQVSAMPNVKAALDLGISADGAARQVLIEADVPQFTATGPTAALVSGIRGLFTSSGLPAGLTLHLAGELPAAVDNQAASGSSLDNTTSLSGLLIIVLLLLAFRAPLAPLVTLIPAAFVLALSGPVIAQATKVGIQASSITQFILVVLVLGAGTDYGVFLVFRVREELRAGLSPHDAVVRSVTWVGESISFSAFTVIVALVSLVLAQFGFYQTMGPPLAIGIGLMLLAGLTLLPALLAIFGRAVFWPQSTRRVDVEKPGLWARVGAVATGRPLTTLVVGVALFGALASVLAFTGTAGFGGATAEAAGTDSAAGGALIRAHFPSSQANRTAILMQFGPTIWDAPGALATAQQGLAALPGADSLVGPLNPNGIPLTTDQLVQLHQTLGPARALPIVPATAGVDPQLYNAYRATGQLVSPDGHTVQFSINFDNGDISSPTALDGVPALRTGIHQVAQAAGAVADGAVGQVTFAYDVAHVSQTDLNRIIPIVALLIALLLAVVIRSLVAPLYLVASVILSYLAALGLAGLIFVHIGGQAGLNFVLPFLMFVFLMALGSDYNILIMSRIREEAHELPLRQAVAVAVGRTGSTITTAGMILGGSFAVLAIAAGGTAGGDQIKQIGYGIAAGVLLDTFLVRSLLVPSIVVLLGRRNWWPSHLSMDRPQNNP